MKKVLLAALLCAASAFATWDYFPVKEAGKGEAKVGFAYFMQDKFSMMGLNAGARFSVIEGLEVALMFNGHGNGPMGFPLSSSYDGNSCEGDFCPPTMAQPTLGLRYWLPMGLGIGLDVSIPFGGEALYGKDTKGTALAITPAVQYSMKLNEQLEIGAEVGLTIPFADGTDAKYAEGMDLGIGLEVDFSLGMVVPFVNVGIAMGLTGPTADGKDIEGLDAAEMGIVPTVGAIININDMLAADVGVGFGLGKRYVPTDDDKMPIMISANFAVKF
jgi:long-subunit fatty acid transport protein